ncbi:MAG: universal stress protein [Haloferacaceae archaeon]
MSAELDTPPSDAESPDETVEASFPAVDPDPFDRVLVLVDGEETGRAAVETGMQLADGFGADVDALFVVDTPRHWDFAVERQEARGEAAVESAADCGERLGLEVEKWFRYGRTHEQVLDFAESHDVDAIVAGSPRSSGLGRLLRPDSLTPRLQRDAEVPVVVVGAGGDG